MINCKFVYARFMIILKANTKRILRIVTFLVRIAGKIQKFCIFNSRKIKPFFFDTVNHVFESYKFEISKFALLIVLHKFYEKALEKKAV